MGCLLLSRGCAEETQKLLSWVPSPHGSRSVFWEYPFLLPCPAKTGEFMGFVQKIFLTEVTVLPLTITLTTSPTLIPARS